MRRSIYRLKAKTSLALPWLPLSAFNQPHFVPSPTPPPPQKHTVQSLAVLSTRPPKMGSPYQLKEGQSRLFHALPSGLQMEFIFQKGIQRYPFEESSRSVQTNEKTPPLVFVHGSFHAAWCWAEHWLPFFSRSGFDCYAVSLLGQVMVLVSFLDFDEYVRPHASDTHEFIGTFILKSPPVLLGHSFGGLIVQSYISDMINGQFSGNSNPKLAGSALVCSVPPSGNSGLVWRYLFSKPVAAFKVTLSLAAKGFATSLPLCKETFFSKEMDDHLAQSYQELMKESSRMSLFDLKKLNASLPVRSVPKSSVNILVVGASNDFIVDNEGLCETAKFYGVIPICVEGVAHDIMLDCSWEKGARVILSWLDGLNGHSL
ncbi:hypothetical protein Syun_021790 [Stephania yunnanensis]|uniref:AB hydrolase-1 domain-containing protein n=1 Tax=Stephania yunnanensis TaxID=152371 RepID=A0AAP0IH93_9MAGN